MNREVSVGADSVIKTSTRTIRQRHRADDRTGRALTTTAPRAITTETANNVRALADAIEAGRLEDASRLIDALGTDLPAEIRAVAAEIKLNLGKWADAAALYDQLIDDAGELTGHQRLHRTFARNMAAMAVYRPAVHDRVRDAMSRIGDAPYRITSDGRGGSTIVYTAAGHGPEPNVSSLSPDAGQPAGTPPLHAFRDILIRPMAKALCGVGDGALLAAIADRPVTIIGDARALVYVIEPDVELLALVLMIRDYSAPDSAIAQANVKWFIGPDWADAARDTLLNNLMLAVPGCYLGQGPHRASTTAQLKSIVAERAHHRDAHRQAATAHAAALYGSAFARRWQCAGDRPPCVLLVTSRHTAVLHHACCDAAEAFRRIGWDAPLLIEQRDHEVMSEEALIAAVASHTPDLIFTIDHLRREYTDLPAGIPFVCWIQDNFENLTSRDAGRSLGARDFVIGSSLLSYLERYDYPADRCVVIPRMAHVAADGPARDPSTPDIVYVSHHSAAPDARLRWVVATATAPAGREAPYRRVLEHAGRALVDLYRAGDMISTPAQMEELIDQVATTSDQQALERDGVGQARGVLFDRLNSTLYRQQALAWAVEVAAARDMSIGIYGHGWDAHPQFARFARGAIDYGGDLASLTRSAMINLVLEPYPPIRHQRLLDGLAAGGFHLCRAHPPELPMQIEWHQFLTEGPGQRLMQLNDAAARLIPADRALLNRMIDSLDRIIPRFTATDPIARFRRFEEWTALVDTCAGPDAMSVDAARNQLSAEDRARFDVLLGHLAAGSSDFMRTDPVRRHRTRQATHGWTNSSISRDSNMSSAEVAFGLPPHFGQVLFTDEASLGRAVDTFINDEDAWRRIAADQQRFVRRHHSYEVGLQRVVEQISCTISRDAASTAETEQTT